MIPLIKEYKKSTPLISIKCGTAINIYITTSKTPITSDGVTWLSDPTLDVELPKQSGFLEQEPCIVTLSRNSLIPAVRALAELLSQPRAAPPMSVGIANLLESAPEDTQRVNLYEGIGFKLSRNPEGQKGKLKIYFLPEFLLYMAESTLGRRVDASCDHVYGGLGCYVDITQYFDPASYYPNQLKKIKRAKVTCSVFSVHTARQLTLTLDPSFHTGYVGPFGQFQKTLTLQPKGWWVRGFLEKDGLRISIVDWRYNDTANIGTDIFILSQVPPLDWNGAQLTLIPGCQRTKEACADRNNSEQFGALGYGIPAYNPTTETDDR
jgi:hypothetical protein